MVFNVVGIERPLLYAKSRHYRGGRVGEEHRGPHVSGVGGPGVGRRRRRPGRRWRWGRPPGRSCAASTARNISGRTANSTGPRWRPGSSPTPRPSGAWTTSSTPGWPRKFKQRLQDLEEQGAPLALVEVPLLFEAGLAAAYDKVIVVDVDVADQVRRLSARDGRSAAEIAGILQAQLPWHDKVKRADFVVDNRGALNHTLRQVKIILGELQKISLTGAAKKVSVPN